MGRRAEAAAHFERFLASASGAPPAIVSAARARLARLRHGLASLRVECLVAGAVISVDGKDVGRTPMDLPHYVEPGSHRVKVSREGFVLSAKTVELQPGEHTTQNVRLRSVA